MGDDPPRLNRRSILGRTAGLATGSAVIPLLAGRADAAQDDEDSTSDGAEKDGDPVLDPGPGSGGGAPAPGHWDPFVDYVASSSWGITVGLTITYPGEFENACVSFDEGQICLNRETSGVNYGTPDCDSMALPELGWIEYTFSEKERLADGTLELTAEGTIWVGINETTKCVYAGSEDVKKCTKIECPSSPWQNEHYIDDAQLREYYRDIGDEVIEEIPTWLPGVVLLGGQISSAKLGASTSSLLGGAAGQISAEIGIRSRPGS